MTLFSREFGQVKEHRYSFIYQTGVEHMGSDRYRKFRPIVEKSPVDCHSISTYGLIIAGILPGRQDQLHLTGPFIEERRCY